VASLEQLLSDLTSGDDARAEAAVPALTVHGQPAIQALRELQTSPIADRRWWATRALSAFPQPEARHQLIEALSDHELDVRQCAALGLKHQPTDEAIEPLIVQLEEDDQLLTRLASDALAEIGASAVPRLSQISQHPNPKIRIQAVRALALMEEPEAVGPLFECIDDPSSMVTYWAEQGLDRLGIGMSFFNPS
jgi:HEAT repeat protein